MSDKSACDAPFNGGFRELFRLFIPLLVITFSNYLFLLVEKLFLARVSIQAMEAAVSSAYVCQIFQGSCVALAMMAQVSIGRWYGAREWKSIGPGLWQFIWFAFISMALTLPIGLIYGKFYFEGMAIKELATPYYTFLMGINFLYPLGAALSCFYLGKGNPRLILGVVLLSQAIKVLLGYVLIFGWGPIPSYGILGGAISTCIAQVVFCGILLAMFLGKKNMQIYDSRAWRFQPKLFWECIYPGLLRVCNRILNFTSWASIAHLMTARGGDYLLILSIGGTLFLFLPMFIDAISQAQVTVISNLLGTKSYFLLKKAFYSGSKLVAFVVVLTAIPLVFFPDFTLTYLFPTIDLEPAVVHRIFIGIWLSFLFSAFSFIPISYVLAFKDMNFSFFMGFFNWINGYLWMYFAIHYLQIRSDQFWLILSVMHGTTMVAYLWRTYKLCTALPVLTNPAFAK